MVLYPRNSTIQIKATNVDPGATGLTITAYEWRINNSVQINNTDTLTVNLATVTAPLNISLRIQNSCDRASTYSETINIAGDIMETTVNIVMDRPVLQVNMILEHTGTAEIDVLDQNGNPVDDVSIELDSMPAGTTNAYGKASIPVPYGPHTLKAIKV